MNMIEPSRIRRAWQGRISGCQLGKPIEALSMMQGFDSLQSYLEQAKALPLRDYVPHIEGTLVDIARKSCREYLCRSEPDDDITYSVLALMMLEEHGRGLNTAHVARTWLRYLPAGATFTAERAAYNILAQEAETGFLFGAPPNFDLELCSDNEYNDWIGAQIRADVYGWVCPGEPALAADLASRDARLSHRDEGVFGAAFIAALGAAIPASDGFAEAVAEARKQIPEGSACLAAVDLAVSLHGTKDGMARIRERYADLSPVHTVNNLAVVVLGLLEGEDDFSQAIGDTVSAGWDTDCNGATVGGLWGLGPGEIPALWTKPWQDRVAVTIAGVGELALEDLVRRTCAVGQKIAGDTGAATS
ncbi:MAG: ADP-ribosylglycohydrolase family protein [Candidatus Binatia bacterium]|nr:ADP-ribosylglycohydrolase family protein [Candidatus Binatia bacterium]MDG1959425.1 ADP-ribosylglycohydrolase family protein [Candidatus Binatia bacterium]MDG2010513.1 ADP-ribosylglycohydrolase family protein [Candidatus Binatia bacterium]HAC80969.1 hypothetical protein [Deltaproteobacteria bacterium]